MVQLFVGVAIVALVGLYMFLRWKWKTPGGTLPMVSEAMPPAVSEDVNLPVASPEPMPSAPSVEAAPTPAPASSESSSSDGSSQ